MEADFWHQKWSKNETGFHGSEAHALLVKYFERFFSGRGCRVFVPLCGKTLDIGWLREKGCRVVGVELVDTAVLQLFAELGVEPKVFDVGNLKHYSSEGIDIFSGNIFDLTPAMVGLVDAIYDRAALVALPHEMRVRYVKHLKAISGRAPQLLISYEYDQQKMDGPPFSVTPDEVREHYSDAYEIVLAESIDVPGGFKNRCAASEHVWLLKNKSQR